MAMVEYKMSSSRVRSYGLVLLLAFGAAVFGVTILDKQRERRLFSLLIKDKDQELVTLHLHLQKERDSNREMKRKVNEIKAKAVTLRTQKMELARELAKMQSMVASLKEEQKTLESTLAERSNKIKTIIKKENYTQNANRGRRGGGTRKSPGEGEERVEAVKDSQVDLFESSRNDTGLKMNDVSDGMEAMQAKDQELSRDRWQEELDISEDDEAEETSMSRMRGGHGFTNIFGKKRRRAISKEKELDKDQNSRESVNLSRKSESNKKNVTEDEKQRVLLREEKEKTKIESGGRKSLDGLERDDHERLSDENQPKMPENSRDGESSEGYRQVETSDEGQMDYPEDFYSQALEMRAGKAVITAADDDQKEAGSRIGQLGAHKNSQNGIARTMEGNEHEVSEDNGDDLRVRRENDVKIKMEDESEAVSNDSQSEVTKKSQDGRRENGKNEWDGEEKRLILGHEQTQSTPEIESLQGEYGEY